MHAHSNNHPANLCPSPQVRDPQVTTEKEEWKAAMVAELEREAQECQRRAAALLEKQRDEEIELVIARLEEESQARVPEADSISPEHQQGRTL